MGLLNKILSRDFVDRKNYIEFVRTTNSHFNTLDNITIRHVDDEMRSLRLRLDYLEKKYRPFSAPGQRLSHVETLVGVLNEQVKTFMTKIRDDEDSNYVIPPEVVDYENGGRELDPTGGTDHCRCCPTGQYKEISNSPEPALASPKADGK